MDHKNLDSNIIFNVFNDMCCFVITDEIGRYLYANRAWTQTMGIDFEDDNIHGRFVNEIIKDTKIGQALKKTGPYPDIPPSPLAEERKSGLFLSIIPFTICLEKSSLAPLSQSSPVRTKTM